MPLTNRIRDSFIAGLVLVAPLAVTLLVLRIIFNWSLQFINPVVRSTRLAEYTANIELVAQVVAAVLIVGSIVLLGYLAEWSVGRRVFGRVGRVVNFIPLVRTVYSSVRQVANSLVEHDSRYESVVLVEYPREGLYSVGFVTSESPAAIEETVDDVAYNVFLPNSPNPTAGRLVLVPEGQIHETDLTIRQGVRLIVTTGLIEDEEDLPALAVGGRPSLPEG